MKYKLDEFMDRHLVPLIESRGVSFTFSKTMSNEYFVKSTPVPNFPSSRYYNFSLIERGSYHNILNASYYLLSSPKESVAGVYLDDESLSRINISSPFSVTYDPIKRVYIFSNPYIPTQASVSYNSFSQVLSVLDRKWYLVNTLGKGLLELVRPEVVYRKSEQELNNLFTDPFFSYALEFIRRVRERFGEGSVSDIYLVQGAINVVLNKRAGEPAHLLDVFRVFLQDQPEDLRPTISRKIIPVVV